MIFKLVILSIACYFEHASEYGVTKATCCSLGATVPHHFSIQESQISDFGEGSLLRSDMPI